MSDADKVTQQINHTLDLAHETMSEDKRIQKKMSEDKPKLKESMYNNDLMDDYRETRDTLKSLISRGEMALDSLYTVATQSEHPRSFEVIATMIKSISDVTDRLIQLQKTIRELEEKEDKQDDNKENGQNVTNNNFFVGSTKELLDEMEREEQERKGKEIDVTPTEEDKDGEEEGEEDREENE